MTRIDEIRAARARGDEHSAGDVQDLLNEIGNLDGALNALAHVLSQLHPEGTHAIKWRCAPDDEAPQQAITWAVESAARVMREELEHHPAHTRNRLTVSFHFGDDDPWNLTMSRGDYEHAMEKQRDEAREEAERLRAHLRDALAR